MKLIFVLVAFMSRFFVTESARGSFELLWKSMTNNRQVNPRSALYQKSAECTNSKDCEGFLDNALCINNKCICQKSWILSNDRTKCLEPATGFESSCEDDAQCAEVLLRGGKCLEGVCKCKEGYHYLKGTCWKSQKLQEKCFRNEQCFSNYDFRGQECKAKICTCIDGYYNRFNSSCRKIRDPGESCNLDSDCTRDHSCDGMKCAKSNPTFFLQGDEFQIEETMPNPRNETLTCPKGKFPLNGICVLELGSTCTTNNECAHIAKATCLNGVCSCEPVLAIANENNRKCLQVARGKVLDVSKSTCKEDPQCSTFGGYSYCLNKKCACKNGTYWEVTNQLCWKVKNLGEVCHSDADCHPEGTHAKCKETKGSNKTCSCEDGYYRKDELCIAEAKEIGGYCDKDEKCLFENAACNVTTNKCVCRDKFYPQNGQCVIGVGSPCYEDKQCGRVQNAKCCSGYCMCNDGYTTSDDSMSCLPVVGFEEFCVETFQCKPKMGLLSQCRNGTCLCNETAHHYNGKCYRTRDIGESCKEKPECFLKGDENSTICLNGYCSCQFEYNMENGNCVISNSVSGLKIGSYLVLCTAVLISLIAPTELRIGS